MSHRPGPRLAFAVALWVLLLGVLPQKVLCFGSGGHVALEALSTLCCSDAHSSAAERLPDCPPDCVDSRLGFSVAARSSDRSPLAGLEHLVTLAIPAWHGTASIFSAPLPGRAARSAPPPARVPRTTVILC